MHRYLIGNQCFQVSEAVEYRPACPAIKADYEVLIKRTQWEEVFFSFKPDQIELTVPKSWDPLEISLYLDTEVLPQFLSTQGHIVLHGSAILKNNQWDLYVGLSGSGKSTQACYSLLEGYPVACDESLYLYKHEETGYTVGPSLGFLKARDEYPLTKLREQKVQNKWIYKNPTQITQSFPIGQIFILSGKRAEERQKTPLKSSEALWQILPHLYCHSELVPKSNKELINRVTEIIESTAVYKTHIESRSFFKATDPSFVDL